MKKAKTLFPLDCKPTFVDSIEVGDLKLFEKTLGNNVLKKNDGLRPTPLAVRVVENKGVPKNVAVLCDSKGNVIVQCCFCESEE